MNNNFFKLSGVALAVATCFSSNVWAADSAADAQDVAQLRKQLGELNSRYEAQGAALQSLAQRLQQLENSGQGQARPMHAVNKTVVAADTSANQTTSDESRAEQVTNEPVVKEAPASRGAEAVYREQNALFNKTFTLETGVSYSHSDRRQLTLNGFLALDAIFLGNIKLDNVKSDIFQLDVTGRYGVTDRLQFDFNAPFLYRTSTFESAGAGSSGTNFDERDVSNTNIGDVSAGAYYRLFPETPTSPDVVVNLRVKAPTGKHPYGIKFNKVGDVAAPDDLPTGNGLWSLSTGVTVVKTVDPAILFANISYSHNFSRKFSDISGGDTPVAGEIDLGDSYQIGGGFAFALSDRMSTSMSYAHRFSQKARIKKSGASWDSIVGSDASAGSLNFGVTYAMTDKLTMVANVGMGVTPDAPDVTVGIKFPYIF
ncbi:MAG: hypothetical protein Q8N02_11040 [Methylotenera sp.]|nr:hypothetical protein [Methylotenera sp.]MDO9233325.1 hypothetical protein [Methylotenera sp.]MDO9389758.1 hypothetical protein [Methylotenera sp.]MDP2403053.1 hypothetical protein [Methylotenera sp.]MDP3096096.1 hypothetical protein [Methylotenera sp.]